MRRAAPLLLLLGSCYRIHYTTNTRAQPAAPVVMHHTFIYGLLELNPTELDQLCPQGFARVEHQIGPVDALLQGCIGGWLWQPSSVEVACAEAPAELPAPPGRSCISSADCHAGGFCRDGGEGITRCAPRGSQGDLCNADRDCARGLACKNPGDGIRKCLGQGARGEPCLVGTDCSAGLACQGLPGALSCR